MGLEYMSSTLGESDNWFETVLDAKKWGESSNALNRAAEAIRILEQKEENSGSHGFMRRHPLTVYLMLLGMSFEAAAKAAYINADGRLKCKLDPLAFSKSQPVVANQGAVVSHNTTVSFVDLKGSSNHKISEMAQCLMDSFDINFDARQMDTIQEIEPWIVAGRYPILLKEDETRSVFGKPVAWSDARQAHFDTARAKLINRVVPHFKVEKNFGELERLLKPSTTFSKLDKPKQR